MRAGFERGAGFGVLPEGGDPCWHHSALRGAESSWHILLLVEIGVTRAATSTGAQQVTAVAPTAPLPLVPPPDDLFRGTWGLGAFPEPSRAGNHGQPVLSHLG